MSPLGETACVGLKSLNARVHTTARISAITHMNPLNKASVMALYYNGLHTHPCVARIRIICVADTMATNK